MSNTEKTTEPGEQNESFMSHLIELRSRLLRAVGTIVVIFFILFLYPGASDIYDLLAAPMLASLPQGTRMIATGVIAAVSLEVAWVLFEDAACALLV